MSQKAREQAGLMDKDEEGSFEEQLCHDVVDELGFGPFHYVLFVITGIAWAADVAEIVSNGILVPVLKTEFDVEDNAKIALIGSMTFAGMLIGSFVFGCMGDVIGRRPTFMVTSFFIFLFSAVSAAATNLETYIALRFVVGLCLGGNLPIDLSMFLEWTPRRYRDKAVLWLTVWSVFGSVLPSVLGKSMLQGDNPRWRLYVIFIALPNAVVMILRPIVPESPRFLICVGRVEKCVDALRRVAKMNRVELSESKISSIRNFKHTEAPVRSRIKSVKASVVSSVNKLPSLFSRTDLAVATVLLALVWFLNAMGCYGIVIWAPTVLKDAINDENLSYIVLICGSCAQPIGILILVLICSTFGQTTAAVVAMLTSVVSALLVWLVQSALGVGIAYAVFNMGYAASYSILYLITSVSYPTSLRTTGFGLCMAVCRLGGIIGPILAGSLYGSIGREAFVIFGVFHFVTALLMVCRWYISKQFSFNEQVEPVDNNVHKVSL
mmetsp:Transcript_6205/g.10659  ORF Transcript_6205/g.10659 Transcript_6205/m.10659 type:complete len:494 (-) Transcript_6205:1994-3475(-)